MSQTRSWLPPGTCFGKVDQKLTRTVREWARAWFGHDDIDVMPEARKGDTLLRSAKPRACASGAWLLVPETATALIARAALHIEAGTRVTEADDAVLDTVGEACLAALCDALAGAVETDGHGDAARDTVALAAGTLWAIDLKRIPARLGFVMSDAARIEFLLRLLPPSPRPPALDSLGLALAPLEVELAANLGTCGVTLSELRSLSVGNVLVLERDLTTASPLAVNGALAPVGACTVSHKAEALLLEISEPIIGIRT